MFFNGPNYTPDFTMLLWSLLASSSGILHDKRSIARLDILAFLLVPTAPENFHTLYYEWALGHPVNGFGTQHEFCIAVNSIATLRNVVFI